MSKQKKNYVLYALYEGEKKYVVMDFASGKSSTADNITEATLFPNKGVCEVVVRTLSPVAQKAYPGMSFGYEVIS